MRQDKRMKKTGLSLDLTVLTDFIHFFDREKIPSKLYMKLLIVARMQI